MKIIAQNYKDGSLRLLDLPAPALKAGGLLVRSRFSVISAGTEMMKVAESKLSLFGKARQRPDQVRKVMQTLAQQGPLATWRKAMNRLDSYTPLGYSLSGVVEAVGADVEGFVVGQRVACGGNQYALHAEVNWAPVNLCVAVPDAVGDEQAAFATIGAIALQGFRQSELKLGETALVVGLGLLGQILVRILKAAGVHAFGVDIDAARCRLATQGGALACAAPDTPEFSALVDEMRRATSQAGVDCAFLMAGGKSNRPVELAVESVRDRGRIVDVGKCGLDLPWNEGMRKEIELRFSRSYGPGRYDPVYEEQGVDYPIGYARWTEKRNMAAFLDLVARGRLDLAPLIDSIHDFDDAVSVYQRMNQGSLKGIGILFRYPAEPMARVVATPMPMALSRKSSDVVRIAAIGCGAYAASMLLPHLRGRPDVALVEVVTTTALSAANAQKKFGFARVSTDARRVLEDPDIDAVMILTPHGSHAMLVAAALRAGKVVFVEKPLAISIEGLGSIVRAIEESGNDRLMVGFNRRFAPLLIELRAAMGACAAAQFFHYRVNAGPALTESWHADRARRGGRFVGEGCHFVDVATWWLGARPLAVTARRIGDDPDELAVVIDFEGGAVASINYMTQGDPRYPKELIEVAAHGVSARFDNFTAAEIWRRGGRRRLRTLVGDKGQEAQIAAFVRAVRAGAPMPIPLASLIDTTAVTLAAERSAATGARVPVAEVVEQARAPRDLPVIATALEAETA
jgi:predicted dehydrogenase/threonine dehydrogenase-like Zn-dependent dehydrogenase